jgi:hypothetical protein
MRYAHRFRVLFVVAMILAGWFGSSQPLAAQPGLVEREPVAAQEGEGFPLTSFAAYCEPGHAGPFDGCTPWEGVTVSFVSADETFSTSCVTTGADRAATCTIMAPFGATIIASIDPATVPAGSTLQQPATQEILIPDGPPEGVFGGPTFVLFADEAPAGETVSMPVYASLCADGFAPHDDCSPWEGALVTVTDVANGTFIGECVTATVIEFAGGCEVTVQRGTSVVASISLDTLPADYQLTTVQIVYDVPVIGEVEGPMFLAIPVEEEAALSPLPVSASICDDALPPNDDCSPWEGVVISAETSDGSFNNTCVTATFFETVAGCEIPMPRGSNVTAYISGEQIPEGYEVFVEVPTWDIPAEGDLESGPYFFLVPVDDEAQAPTPVPPTTPAGPVKVLPSTGSGEDSSESNYLMLAGASILLVIGAEYVSSLRQR